jgi:hypothetical protein
MNEQPPGTAGLAGLVDRLRGGVGPTIQRARPPGYNAVDEERLRRWEPGAFGQLADLRSDTWSSDRAEEVISALAGELRDTRPLLTAVLFAPDRVLAWRISKHELPGETALTDCWAEMFYIAEAAWLATAEELPASKGYAAGDAAYLRPAAARLRFLILSEPMRWRGKGSVLWIEQDEYYAGRNVVDRLLGKESWRLLVARCREARAGWRDYLDAYQAYPLLSQARPAELERELRALVFGGSGPLSLPVAWLADLAPLTAEDKTLIGDAAERHFLPRFEVLTVARLAMDDHRRGCQVARQVTSGAVVVAAVTAVAFAAALRDRPAVAAAVVCYLLICAGVLVFPAGWGTMWLLRMPAAAAVGMVLLTGFLPAGWLRTPPGGWLAVVALAGASFGYLLIEVRNHGVSAAAAVGRALLVAVIGAMHALMVSVIGLAVVAPAFVLDGKDLRDIWTHPSYGHTGMVLALAVAWCLAVGVFSQILWDDRPITAPLAHLSWRG